MPPVAPIVFGLFLLGLGVAIGRRMVRLAPDQVVATRREVWRYGPSAKYRRNPKTLRVYLTAFGALVVTFGVGALASYIGAWWLQAVAVTATAMLIGVGWGAMIFGGFVKASN
jgi:hypothetical protein